MTVRFRVELSPQARVRKLLMPRSRYHLYYEVDQAGGLVTVLAVWHAVRGAGPRL